MKKRAKKDFNQLNSGNSKKRHIHFSKEETICGIDPDPWVSPELPMSNSDDKTDPFTQPQDKNLLIYPEDVLAEPGECKKIPIVIDGEEVMQVEDQGKELTLSEEES